MTHTFIHAQINKLNFTGWSFQDFQTVGVSVGCDYVRRVRGHGWVTLVKLFNQLRGQENSTGTLLRGTELYEIYIKELVEKNAAADVHMISNYEYALRRALVTFRGPLGWELDRAAYGKPNTCTETRSG